MKRKLNCIMLIDDDFATNLYHKIVIEESGCAHHVLIKNDGQEALDYLRSPFGQGKPKPDLIFLDINMPKMDGWEFLEAYTKLAATQQAENVIVMMSTSSNPDDLGRAKLNEFVKDYRSKPLTVGMLEEIVEKYCY